MPTPEDKDKGNNNAEPEEDETQVEGEVEGEAEGEEDKDKDKGLTLEQALTELAKARTALRKANRESADRRKELKTLRDATASSGKSADDKDKEISSLKTQNEDLQKKLQAERISNEVFRVATKLKFHDPAVAFKLLDMDDIEVDEKGAITGVEDALKVLASEKKYLIQGKTEETPEIDANKRSTTKTPSQAEIIAEKRKSDRYTPF